VEPMGLSCEAHDWLHDRGIRPSTAIAYGWRDWRQQRKVILDILDDYGPDDLLQAGLVGQSSDGDLYGWKPLRGLKEQRHDTRGIMIPIWHPDYAEPVALRFRPYQPDEYKRHGCKSDDQPSSHLDDWTPPPLGLRGPTPEMHMMMALRDDAWPHTLLTTEVKRDWLGTQTTPPDPDDTPRRLDRYPGNWFAIICEGETDMLAVADAAREMAGPRLVPVALTRKASPISERVRSLVARADHIHMALDTPDESPDNKRPTWRDRYDEIARTVLLRHGTDEGEQRLSSQPVFESHDLNDFHQDDELTTYLQRYLEVSR